VDANDFAPGGVDFLQYSCGGSYNQSESLVNPAHADVEGTFNPRAKALTAADFVNWNVTDLGQLSGLPWNAKSDPLRRPLAIQHLVQACRQL
jgi:hypothetical protein